MTLTVSGARLCYQCETAVKLARRAKKARTAEKRAPRVAKERIFASDERVRRRDLATQVVGRCDEAGGLCELGCGNLGTEIHHLEYGRGVRTSAESLSNMMMVCRACHDAYHARPRRFVEAVKAWCTKHGYSLPARKEFR